MAKTWGSQYRKLGPRGFLRWLLIKRAGRSSFRKLDEVMARSSLVGTPAVFDPSLFPWVAEFEAGASKVRAELDALLTFREHLPALQEIQPDQISLSEDRRWRTFVLWGFGFRSEANCARCPETTALLERVPGLTSAWFSILAPGKHIPRHSGVTRAVIRGHLGLIVPKGPGRCEMSVAGNLVRWQEGRIVLFDDACKHEVWNETSEERAVLIFDVKRPMRWPGRVASRVLHGLLWLSPFVRDARRNHEKWEARVEGVIPTSSLRL